jgi:hypothetical protein
VPGWLVCANAALAMVRVSAVAAAAAIANFFIRVTPVFLESLLVSFQQGYQRECERCANFETDNKFI